MALAYQNFVASASSQYGVPAALINAVIDAESGFNPNAVSPAGAQGLMQLMPRTAAGLGVTNPFDPAQNIDGGTRYLAGLYAEFGDWTLTIAAYNAGPGAVQSYHGVPPYHETQTYVSEVLALWKKYQGTAGSTSSSSAGSSPSSSSPAVSPLPLLFIGLGAFSIIWSL